MTQIGNPIRQAVTKLGLAFAAASLGLAIPTFATAASAPTGGGSAVAQAISKCRGIVGAQARLACYDKASEAFDKARAEGQVMIVDRDQVNAVRCQAFGLKLPTLSFFSFGQKYENIDKTVTKIVRAYAGLEEKWIINNSG